MVKFFSFFITVFLISAYSNAQKGSNNFSLSLSGGNFMIGHGYVSGIWTSVEGSKVIYSNKKRARNKLAVNGELYFENGADKATILNPTWEQFISDQYFHESNTGISAKIGYYPFGGFLQGLHIAAGPLLAYSIRTYEKRAEIIQYSPTIAIRMSELGSDNKLLGGYRVTVGYDLYLRKHWLAGIRADFMQYHSRDLNSLLGLKAGYRF